MSKQSGPDQRHQIYLLSVNFTSQAIEVYWQKEDIASGSGSAVQF